MLSLAKIKNNDWKQKTIWFIGFAFSALIAFFSYHGLKFVALEWFAFISGWILFFEGKDHKVILLDKKKRSAKLFFWLIAANLVIVSLLLSIVLRKSLYASRGSELVISNLEVYSGDVSKMRQLALWPAKLEYLFINKYTFVVQQITKTYFNFFDVKSLFFVGEQFGAFSLRNHGYFYLFDAFFMICGIYYLISKKQPSGLLLLGLIFIAVIPSAIHIGESYALRASLAFPLLIMLSGIGLYTVIDEVNNLKSVLLKTSAFLCLGVVLFISIGYFCGIFYGYFPLLSNEDYFFSERLLASYINRVPKEQKVIILTENPYALLRADLFYNQLFTQSTLLALRPQLKDSRSPEFNLQNVQFISQCPDHIDSSAIIFVDEKARARCEKVIDAQLQRHLDPPRLSLVKIDDSGEIFGLYHDVLCKSLSLPRYISVQSWSELKVENLSNNQFCQEWITQQAPVNEIKKS